MQTLGVKFDNGYGSKTYHYLYDLNEPVLVGDTVVVSVSEELRLVKVVSVLDGVSEKATKYVVDRVDVSKYKARQEKERKRTVLRTQLESLLKNQEELLKYRMLASMNTQAAELLRELEELNRG